ncbi:MAG: hypothetical protein IT331_08375 [Anaerolineae bacterium]|nr:hypothetical protein [Anaerolineae bacterium]
MDTTFFVQLGAVLLFAVCFIHSWRNEGQRMAQQWFLIGYIFAVVIASLLVVMEQIAYNPNMLVFGAAPSLVVMLFPGIFYVAYVIAKRFVDPIRLGASAYMMFIIVPWLMLPLDALAINAEWWYFPSESVAWLNGIPFYVPFAWGLLAATFGAMIGRVRKIRFRGNGQFFAMMIAAPLVAGLDILLLMALQIMINLLGVIGGTSLLYLALVILYFLFPLASVFNLPRLRESRMSARVVPRKK